jgi:type VI secretion system secreted protein VgrG
MATYTQADRPLEVSTSLGEDVLLLVGFSGQEAISQLFDFHLDLIAENRKAVAFDKLLGQKITIRLGLGGDQNRYFNGICNRVSQGHRDDTFTQYRMEVVPQFWFLTRRAQSRIFQHLSVPDILKKVLDGLDVSFELQGTFQPRDFCVQYRETDFNFASRLMEEEGIYYFFKHSADGHKMFVANTPRSHPDMPEMNKVIYEELTGGVRDEFRIYDWEKVQELRSGKYTLWDHCFELPHKHLAAEEPILPDVQVGDVQHKLRVGGNDALEIYDYPGGYAQRFDGINKGGGEQSGDLQKISEDNKRTVKIRMQQEALPSLVIQGASDCRNFVSGHKFTLERHFDANGDYLLTSVSHSARLTGDFRTGEGEFDYQNSFKCIPFAIVYRPLMVTPKPVVQGTQTAVVVGPAGEEIFVDKYGRVKVQFHWDREGSNDADSSCWIRVATPWAGKKWGAINIPRVGMEVIVDFLEGDADQPIIVGSVYNADMMPPYELPKEQTKSTNKTMSSKGGGGFNEIRFEDMKGKEQIFIHGEKDEDIRIKNDRREWIGNDRHLIVKRDKFEQIERDEQNLIKRDQIEEIGRDHHLKIKGKEAIAVDGSHSFTVSGNVNEKFSQSHNEEAGMSIHVKAGMTLILEAGVQISLKVGGNFIDINPAGVTIFGTMVLINSGGAPGSGPGASVVAPTAPKEALIADNADPGSLADSYKSQQAALSPLQLAAANAPWHDPDKEKKEGKKSWIEIVLVDKDNNPVPGERYRITLPDGSTLAEGTLDEKGFARVDGIDPGTCKVTFPNLDKDTWESK